MTSEETEAREWAESCPIADATPQVEAAMFEDCDGMLIARETDDEWGFWVYRRRGLAPDVAAGFDRWARQRLYVVALAGHPQIDGWHPRSDGGWYIVGRRAAPMPPDPFLEP